MSTVLAQVTQPRGELATGCSPVGEYHSVRECQLRSENLYDIALVSPGQYRINSPSAVGTHGQSDILRQENSRSPARRAAASPAPGRCSSMRAWPASSPSPAATLQAKSRGN